MRDPAAFITDIILLSHRRRRSLMDITGPVEKTQGPLGSIPALPVFLMTKVVRLTSRKHSSPLSSAPHSFRGPYLYVSL